MVNFGKEWFPHEALVDAGRSEIPMRRIRNNRYKISREEISGTGGMPMEEISMDDMKFVVKEEGGVHVVRSFIPDPKDDAEPPADVMSSLNLSQQDAFKTLWNRVPAHLRKVHFDFNSDIWKAEDIVSLGINCFVGLNIDFPRMVRI